MSAVPLQHRLRPEALASTGKTVAVTGATGFVGRHAVAALAARGWRVRVLARSEPAHPLWRGLNPEVVLGALDDGPALERLVHGTDAVLHLAGAIKARDTAAFMQVNRDGTAALVAAVQRAAPDAHFLHVSSLAAREPQLSGYSASKQAGEAAVTQQLAPRQFSVLRPPAVYGPGDRETMVFFQLGAQPVIPLLGRPSARIAVIQVEDAVAAFASRLAAGPSGAIQYLADDQPAGYSWRQILQAAADATGNARPRYVQVPRPLLKGLGSAASVGAGLLGKAAMFNAGKLRELLHEDWSVNPAELFRPSPPPRYGLVEGFRSAAAWYRQAGWL